MKASRIGGRHPPIVYGDRSRRPPPAPNCFFLFCAPPPGGDALRARSAALRPHPARHVLFRPRLSFTIAHPAASVTFLASQPVTSAAEATRRGGLIVAE